jgi:hypothetical protein
MKFAFMVLVGIGCVASVLMRGPPYGSSSLWTMFWAGVVLACAWEELCERKISDANKGETNGS